MISFVSQICQYGSIKPQGATYILLKDSRRHWKIEAFLKGYKLLLSHKDGIEKTVHLSRVNKVIANRCNELDSMLFDSQLNQYHKSNQYLNLKSLESYEKVTQATS